MRGHTSAPKPYCALVDRYVPAQKSEVRELCVGVCEHLLKGYAIPPCHMRFITRHWGVERASKSFPSIDRFQRQAIGTMAEFKDEKWQSDLYQVQTQRDGEVEERRFSADGRRISITDAVFGDIVEGGVNYRNVGSPMLAIGTII